MGSRSACLSVAAAVIGGALATPAALQQPRDTGTDKVTIAFSDPSRVGSLEVAIVRGNITVRGTNRKDVAIEAQAPDAGRERRRQDDEPPPPGLRRLTQAGSFTVEEDANVVSVDVSSPNHRRDFTIEVPLRTNLELNTVDGTIVVEGVQGNLEIENVNGTVTLTRVGGSVVANTVNGKLVADVTQVTPQKPMAFTSLNGTVDVTLPASVKANLRLRSDEGEVYTDFDLQVRPDVAAADDDPGRRRGRHRIEVNKAIYGSLNGGGPEFEMRTFRGNVYVRKGK